MTWMILLAVFIAINIVTGVKTIGEYLKHRQINKLYEKDLKDYHDGIF